MGSIDSMYRSVVCCCFDGVMTLHTIARAWEFLAAVKSVLFSGVQQDASTALGKSRQV